MRLHLALAVFGLECFQALARVGEELQRPEGPEVEAETEAAKAALEGAEAEAEAEKTKAEAEGETEASEGPL